MKWRGNNKCKTIQCQWINQKNKLKIAFLMEALTEKKKLEVWWAISVWAAPNIFHKDRMGLQRLAIKNKLALNMNIVRDRSEMSDGWFICVVLFIKGLTYLSWRSVVFYTAVCSLSSTGASSYSSLHKILRKRDGNILLSFIILLIQSRDRPICCCFFRADTDQADQ